MIVLPVIFYVIKGLICLFYNHFHADYVNLLPGTMSRSAENLKARGFHKKGAKANIIPGTKPSIHNSTLLVSTGVPSLDALIGMLC